MERMRPLADIRSSVMASVDSYPRPLSADWGADERMERMKRMRPPADIR
jgi:hypothetical protein